VRYLKYSNPYRRFVKKLDEEDESKKTSNQSFELLQEYGHQYLSWIIDGEVNPSNEPKDWDDLDGPLGGQFEVECEGYFEVKTNSRGIKSAQTFITKIHIPKSKWEIIKSTGESSETSSFFEIPATTLSKIIIGDWDKGQFNPEEIKLDIDLTTKVWSISTVWETDWSGLEGFR
jgi:hypothetical protein